MKARTNTRKACERIDLQEYNGQLRLLLPRLSGEISDAVLDTIVATPRMRQSSDASIYAFNQFQKRVFKHKGFYVVTDHDVLAELKKVGLVVHSARFAYIPPISQTKWPQSKPKHLASVFHICKNDGFLRYS